MFDTVYVCDVPPPRRYRPIEGVITNVSINKEFFGARNSTPTQTQRRGLRYEDKVLSALADTFANSFVSGPALHFRDKNGFRTLVPDGLFFPHRNRVVVIEVKLSHTSDAWWQLRKLYEPVLRALFLRESVLLCEVCRNFDPQTPFPEVFVPVDRLMSFALEAKDGTFGVYPWKL